ncbi:NACHT domain-containing protein [Flavobacterium sp. ZT3R25]|uniref:NACHT domain-containing protein n=1 Tax=Flavobacterium galactosi TaxID=3398735 RepID=UPI003A8658B7
MEIISKVILSHLIKEASSNLKTLFNSNKIQLITTSEDLLNALYEHSVFVINSTQNIFFKDLGGSRKISDVYIDLHIELQAKRLRFSDQEQAKSNIEEILLNTSTHLVILGGPGAGKTTTIKHICQMLLNNEITINYKFPILINLRDITDGESIYSKLKTIFGIEISSKQQDKTISLDNLQLRERYINSYLNSLNIVLILDGLDEVRPSRISQFYQEIKSLMLNLNNSLVIVTSRSASYNISIDNSTEYELCDLNQNQIVEFVNKWFVKKNEATEFITNLNSSKFFDFSLRPLTLAHLCAIFEKTKKFYDKPRSIYKKLVRLLIDEWDEQRGIVRESKYSDFDNERKFDFLSHFAYDLTISYAHKKYSEFDFIESYKRIYMSYQLPLKDGEKVVKELEDHTGIIIKSSYDSYEFVHKSMQEYLAAEYIVRLVNIPVKLIYDTNISNELAIAVSLSSNPNEYLYKLIFEIFKPDNLHPQFAIEFLSRLEYERPIFRESLLIPFSFIYLFNLLAENSYIFDRDQIDEEFDSQSNIIYSSFQSDFTIKKSFRRLKQYIQLDRVSKNSAYIIIDEAIETELLTDEDQFYMDNSKKYIISEKLYQNYFQN